MVAKKILLIEDDSFISEMYYTKLKDVGYEVETAYDGEDGLKKVSELKPDLILLDIRLPKLDGLELLSIIKGKDDLKNIPVIILSNLGEKEDIEKGLSLGAIDYLIKAHYTPTEVVEKVTKAIEGR